jgi:hypothetical protein
MYFPFTSSPITANAAAGHFSSGSLFQVNPIDGTVTRASSPAGRQESRYPKAFGLVIVVDRFVRGLEDHLSKLLRAGKVCARWPLY